MRDETSDKEVIDSRICHILPAPDTQAQRHLSLLDARTM
jgi:hypothetical protein